MNAKKWISVSIYLLACRFALCEHSPLLPRPQQVQYSGGTVSLRNARIMLPEAAGDADRFAAEQLRSWIRQRTGFDVTVVAHGNPGSSEAQIVMDREGATDEPLGKSGEQPGQNSREAYDLKVSATGINIHARSSAGIFYGAETLRQLIEGEGASAVLPEVEIHDWPSLAFRGTMLDISHGPLPTEKEIERQLDFLARWKANQYYLYSEDSIELTGYPLLALGGRLTRDEVRRIVAYGRDRHIDVIPNFDLYGHEHDLFRVEKYSHLSDEPHGTEFDASNPEVEKVLEDWVNQFTDLFPSPFVSIGFDETFQIEAATHATGAAAAPAELFVKQLTSVASLFQQHGKTVMAYDDIMVKYPQVIPRLPKGMIAVAWYYTSEDPTYKHWLGPLEALHFPHIVQPGVTSYDDIAPDFDTSFENIDTFLAAGRKSGAIGLVNSVWADDAQLLFRMSLPGIAYCAAAPWQSVAMDRDHFFSDYALQMYPPLLAPDIASALGHMTKAETAIKNALGEQSMFGLWEDPFFPTIFSKLESHREDLHQTRIHAEEAEEALLHARSLGVDPETMNSLLIGSELLDYAGQKYQAPLDMSAIWNSLGSKRPDPQKWWNVWESQVTHYDHSYVTDLMDRIADLKPEYKAEWLEEYAPYRLGSALGRWEAEYQYWRGVHEKLRHFNDCTKEGDPLPKLKEVIEDPLPSWAHPH